MDVLVSVDGAALERYTRDVAELKIKKPKSKSEALLQLVFYINRDNSVPRKVIDYLVNFINGNL